MAISDDNDDRRPDPILDLVGQASRADGGEDRFPVDESDLLAYINGEASDEVAAAVRVALAGSVALRDHFRQIVADLAELESPAAQARFAAQPEPSPPESLAYDSVVDPWAEARARAHAESPRPSVLERLRGLFLKPAFAAAFVFLVMAYPTAWYLLTGNDRSGQGDANRSGDLVAGIAIDRSSLLSASRTFRIDAGVPVTHGDEPPTYPIVTVAGGTERVRLMLWSASPLQPGLHYELRLLAGDQPVWETDDFRPEIDPADPTRIDLEFTGGRLQEGRKTILVTRRDRDTKAVVLEEEFYFELKIER